MAARTTFNWPIQIPDKNERHPVVGTADARGFLVVEVGQITARFIAVGTRRPVTVVIRWACGAGAAVQDQVLRAPE